MLDASMSVEDKVRTITAVRIVKTSEHELSISFSGNGFLYKQVRNMVGTLIKVGLGKWPASRISDIIVAQNRDLAGPTAPAHGLCLMEVNYRDDRETT